MERRIVAQFLTCMDGKHFLLSAEIWEISSVVDMSWEKNDNKPVIVIGATNRPDSLDAALRRAGRFDHEISMGVPDDEARAKYVSTSSRLKSVIHATASESFASYAPNFASLVILTFWRLQKQLLDMLVLI